MQYTAPQRAAIECRDRSIYLSAAAGSGKTAVLTARIIAALTDPVHPTSLSRLLAVTFTESAALEMRTRIGRALSATLREGDGDGSLARELRLLPTADISTIDAFCHKLLRRYGTHIVPEGFRVMDEAEADARRADLMEETIAAGYGGRIEGMSAEAFSTLSTRVTDLKGERRLGETLLSLYDRLTTYERGVASLDDYAARYIAKADEPVFSTSFGRLLAARIRTSMTPVIEDFLTDYAEPIYALEATIGDHSLPDTIRAFAARFEALTDPTDYDATRAACLAEVPKCNLKDFGKAWKPFLQESDLKKFLKDEYGGALALAVGKRSASGLPPCLLYDEAGWRALLRELGHTLAALSCVLKAFDARYFADGRRRRAFDFNQLTRATYRLLIDEAGERTPVARSLSACYDMVCVDEYQDVSPLQHAIFAAVSTERNRFYVGDIKQSIYRFRHAEPDIFASLRGAHPRLAYDPASGTPAAGEADAYAHFMGNNFRCDREIVSFVNAVFSFLFGAAGESIGYAPETDDLVFTKDAGTTCLFPIPSVHCFDQIPNEVLEQAAEENPDPDREMRWTPADREALRVAGEISRLLREETRTDGATPLRPRDIVIISRTRQRRSSPLLRALDLYGIPVAPPEEESFFAVPEILLATSLLSVIDNPLSDIPLASVLCSPLYHMTPDLLADIRREAGADIPLYDALRTYVERHPACAEGIAFLTQLASFRREAENSSVAHLLRRIFAETPLYSLAGADGRHAERNLKLLYHEACTFAGAEYEGLHGFLRYVVRQSESKKTFRSPGGAAPEDAVRITTIHGSKGLEYPVVFLYGAGQTFSTQDERATFLCDHELGVVMPLRVGAGQVRLEHPLLELMKLTLRDKAREEEMRLLYVALTRAQERLYITGCPRGQASLLGKGAAQERIEAARRHPDRPRLLACTSYLEWLLALSDTPSGRIHCEVDRAPIFLPHAARAERTPRDRAAVGALTEQLRRQFAASEAITHPPRLPKKLAVSALHPRLLDGSEGEETPLPLPTGETDGAHEKHRRLPSAYAGAAAPDPTERGIATHQFLQFCDFRRLADEGIEAEGERLLAGAYLTEAQMALIRPEELEAFRLSPLFAEMLAAREIRREFRFHMFLPAALFTSDEEEQERLAGEQLFIQGVIDAIITAEDGSMTLVDYKTDRLSRAELADPALAAHKLRERHREQLRYYAAAIERIFGRPPTHILLYSLHAGLAFDADPERQADA